MASHNTSTDSYLSHHLRRPWRLLRRGVAGLGVLLLLGLAINEGAVQCDAYQARKDRNLDAIYTRLDDTYNPPKGSTANIWQALEAAKTIVEPLRDAANNEQNAIRKADLAAGLGPADSRVPEVWFATVGRAWMSEAYDGGVATPMDQAYAKACAEVSQSVLSQLERENYLALLDSMAAAGDARAAIQGDASESVYQRLVFPHSTATRLIFDERVAAAWLAHEAGNDAAFFRATTHAMAVVQAHAKSPRLFEQTRAVFMSDYLCDVLRGALMNRADAGTLSQGWIDSLRDVLARYPMPVDLSHALELMEASALDTHAWIFAAPSSTRFAKLWPGERLTMFDPVQTHATGPKRIIDWRQRLTRSVGRYAASRDAMANYYKLLKQNYTSQDAFTQPMLRESMPPIAEKMVGSRDRWYYSDWGRTAQNFRVLQTMLAIEEHKLVHKQYPLSLEELGTERLTPATLLPAQPTPLLPTNPRPPLLHRELLYRLRGGADEADNRNPADTTLAKGYVLYLRGPDGRDDGGKPTQEPWWDPAFKTQMGLDFVVSRTSMRRSEETK